MIDRFVYTLRSLAHNKTVSGLLDNRYARTFKIIMVVFAGATVLFVLYFPNCARLKKMRSANREMNYQNALLRKEIKELSRQLAGSQKDSSLYEKYARDYLGVAKDGEIVVDIVE